jgi:hypothetical protein
MQAAPDPSPAPSFGDSATRHLLSALHQALDLSGAAQVRDEMTCLRLLEARVAIALASIARLIDDPQSDGLDYMSEGDHILHQLAELPPTRTSVS